MQVVPLQPVPSQQVKASLNGQDCQIDVRQRRTGLFVDLYISDQLVVAGVLCLDRNALVRSAYLGLTGGDLMFIDTQGTEDPSYTGLGGRFALVFLTPADVVP